MRLLLVSGLCAVLARAQQQPPAMPQTPENSRPVKNQSTTDKKSIIVPAGTKVALVTVSPVWGATVNAGDPVYATSDFPVAVDDQIALPPGTYIEGIMDSIVKPTRKTNRAEFRMHFTKIIFANGYTVLLAENPPAASANVNVEVSYLSDILLDIGSQFQMALQVPLQLDAANVADALLKSKAPPIGPVESATRCRPTPGTPGTSDTVIPGTPGTPGTPPTVIPGGPGLPPTVIPGTPGTPGTPPTVIAGSPGTPGYTCPPPPIVISSSSDSSALDDHVKYVTLATSLEVGNKALVAGTYQVAWSGAGPSVSVKMSQKGKLVLTVEARVVALQTKAAQNSVRTREGATGTAQLQSLEFQGEQVQLVFD